MRTALEKPRVLEEFAGHSIYWDSKWQRYVTKIGPGEYFVACDDMVITTVLGSCVSACIHDPVTGMGGINHFMLPPTDSNSEAARSMRYGLFAMEQLVNGLMRHGSQRQNMQVKVTGGGKILAGMTDIGLQNIDFIRKYLRDEGFTVLAEDLGGDQARKVVYFPASGRLLVNRLDHQADRIVVAEERAFTTEVEHQLDDNDVELF